MSDARAHSPAVRTAWLAAGAALVAAVIYLSVVSLSLDADIPGGDKLHHLAAYATLMLWFAQAARGGARSATALALIALGIGLEFVQATVPGRQFDVLDMVANSAGVLLAWLAAPPRTPNVLERLERLAQTTGRNEGR